MYHECPEDLGNIIVRWDKEMESWIITNESMDTLLLTYVCYCPYCGIRLPDPTEQELIKEDLDGTSP